MKRQRSETAGRRGSREWETGGGGGVLVDLRRRHTRRWPAGFKLGRPPSSHMCPPSGSAPLRARPVHTPCPARPPASLGDSAESRATPISPSHSLFEKDGERWQWAVCTFVEVQFAVELVACRGDRPGFSGDETQRTVRKAARDGGGHRG